MPTQNELSFNVSRPHPLLTRHTYVLSNIKQLAGDWNIPVRSAWDAHSALFNLLHIMVRAAICVLLHRQGEPIDLMSWRVSLGL